MINPHIIDDQLLRENSVIDALRAAPIAANGKIERFFQTCKNEAVRRQSYLSLDDLKRQIAEYIEHYNTVRLHSANGCITPQDMLLGRRPVIF